MGHNFYGEPAWPNDILYIFPVVILGVGSLIIGLASTEALALIEPSTPFATPIEILPEWYFFPTFNLLRILPDKCVGVLSMLFFPASLLVAPLLENLNRYQNPLRRPIALLNYILVIIYSIWLSVGSLELIIKALPLF